MRRNVPTVDNKGDMLECFSITRFKRVDMVAKKELTATQILNNFPRLMDTYEAVIMIIFTFFSVNLQIENKYF